MPSSMTLEQVGQKSTQELAKLTASDLLQLQNNATDAWQNIKRVKDKIHDALILKYKDQASVALMFQGKDSGVIHIDDNGIQVTANLPKKVSWDQAELAAIAKRIEANREDPLEYLDVTYKISEKRYSSWPENLKSAFRAARTFSTGLQTFKLTQGDEQ